MHRGFCKKEIFKHFSKFTEKHLCWRLFKKEVRSHNLLEQFLHRQRLILLYYFLQKILKQKTAVFKKQKPPLEIFHEKGVLKFYKIYRETPVSESLFDLTLLKIFWAKETRSLHVKFIFFPLHIMNCLYIK